jgi:hypothetical protein
MFKANTTMVQKTVEKNKAIVLRKRGLSYREILVKVPVAKSTLSLWLRSVGLSKRQRQRLTEKRLAAIRRGGIKVTAMRLERIEKVRQSALKEVSQYIDNSLWVVGTILYWAEGSKMKPWRRGERVSFSNMDPVMIGVFQKWLTICLKVPLGDIGHEIYIHRNSVRRLQKVRNYWSKVLKVPTSQFRIYFKNHNPSPHRHNLGNEYYGVMRIRVNRSSALNHRIGGWIEGLCNYIAGW